MIPLLLGAVGAYLIGKSVKDKQIFARGGNTSKGERLAIKTKLFSLKSIKGNAHKISAVSDKITKQLDKISATIPFKYKVKHSGTTHSTYILIGDRRSSENYIIRVSDHDKTSPTRKGHFETQSPDWNINVSYIKEIDLSMLAILNKINSHKEYLPSSFIGDEILEENGLDEELFLKRFNDKVNDLQKQSYSEGVDAILYNG